MSFSFIKRNSLIASNFSSPRTTEEIVQEIKDLQNKTQIKKGVIIEDVPSGINAKKLFKNKKSPGTLYNNKDDKGDKVIIKNRTEGRESLRKLDGVLVKGDKCIYRLNGKFNDNEIIKAILSSIENPVLKKNIVSEEFRNKIRNMQSFKVEVEKGLFAVIKK